VTSGDVNDYLRRVTGEPFSAKDFRTWSGTLLALHELDGGTAPASEREARRGVRQALEQVSVELGNTVSVCRKSYVHPLIIDQYARGELAASLGRARRAARRAPLRGLREIETVALYWLRALPAGLDLEPHGAKPRAVRGRRAAPQRGRSSKG
jgi:DNA topoisomerase-1